VIYRSSRIVTGTPDAALRVLQDARLLDTWNPALGPLEPADPVATVGRPYATLIRGLVQATVVYEEASIERMRYRLTAPGASESGTWDISRLSEDEIRVTHTFEHHGVLLAIMRQAFASVAAWRLDRFEQELTAPHLTP
jgi:hypothetical protein